VTTGTASTPPGGGGTVTVSMPYYRSPRTIRRAVDAVLAQTHTDLVLCVVNDGDTDTPPWPHLADITDPRLVRVDLPVNRGRYFADAAVIAAAVGPWIAIHDADDQAHPDWLAALVGACTTTGAVAAVCTHYVHGATVTALEPPRTAPVWGDEWTGEYALLARPAPGMMRHLAHHSGVYRTDIAQRVGGHPRYRIGFDSLFTNVVAMLGPVAVVEAPLFHRYIQPGSLTTAAGTRPGSAARLSVRRTLNLLYRRAVRAADPAQVIRDDVPQDLADLVDEAARGILDGSMAVTADAGKDTTTMTTVHNPDSVLYDPAAWTGWALDTHTAQELAAWLHHAQPQVIVEAGSGWSTVLFAEYASRTGATVVSLEHAPSHAAATEQQLRRYGLNGYGDVRISHMVDTPAGPWYSAPMPDQIDFALVDGPPGTIGRIAALPHLWARLRGDWRVWVDDSARDGERTAVDVWAAQYPITCDDVDLPKGLTVVRAGLNPGQRPVDASDVAVTMVTGNRPDLLMQTITSLQHCAPGLLATAHVAVLHNGADAATARVLDKCDFIDHRATTRELVDVGPAAASMLGTPAPRPYVLHLEDDWIAATTIGGWLDRARAALDDPRIGQVRLRHRGDKVLARHMVTRQPIDWRTGPDGHVVASAHYTLNPSLMRAADTPTIWNTGDGEAQAQGRFVAQGWLTAQAVPGVFRHTGDGKSLRLRQVP
jgi:predicted O-methyltransferase YrrM